MSNRNKQRELDQKQREFAEQMSAEETELAHEPETDLHELLGDGQGEQSNNTMDMVAAGIAAAEAQIDKKRATTCRSVKELKLYTGYIGALLGTGVGLRVQSDPDHGAVKVLYLTGTAAGSTEVLPVSEIEPAGSLFKEFRNAADKLGYNKSESQSPQRGQQREDNRPTVCANSPEPDWLRIAFEYSGNRGFGVRFRVGCMGDRSKLAEMLEMVEKLTNLGAPGSLTFVSDGGVRVSQGDGNDKIVEHVLYLTTVK
ncbi:MAG: hypothetical protein Q7S19_01975 [bacterium]|nr:hypothetical protein [bacterium]